MRVIIIIMNMLLCSCAALSENIKLSYDLPKADVRWVERNPPTAPLNDAEVLATRSAAGLMTLKLDGETAHFEGKEDSFTVIRHELLPTDEVTYVITVKYRISNGLVYAETIPLATALFDKHKEEFARVAAFNSVNGTTPEIPTIYDGRMYIARYNAVNSCTVDVVEKDLDREYYTYRIKTC